LHEDVVKVIRECNKEGIYRKRIICQRLGMRYDKLDAILNNIANMYKIYEDDGEIGILE